MPKRKPSSNNSGFAILTILLFVPVIAVFPVIRTSARSNQTVRSEQNIRVSPSETTRRNVGRFFDKMRAGKTVSVAWFGGSVTAGADASDPAKTSYRALVSEWLRAQFPQARIQEINASVGGTGSLYASMRARRDVIAHKPDLVFIEFAANDAEERESVVKRSVEGILRQFLTVPQPPEIVLLYAPNEQRNARAEWHDEVAAYYRTPSLDLQEKTWKLIKEGKFSSAALWKNGGHPLDAGHRVFAQLITDFLSEQQKAQPSPLYRSIPPPYLSDELTYGELIPVAQLKHDGLWKPEQNTDRTLPSTLLVSDKTGAVIETVFEGTVLGLAFKAGPDAGIIECLIDGKTAPAPLDRIDAYSAKHQIATRIIAGGLGPGEHRLTIKISADKNAKNTGTNVRLGYLIVGGQRPERL